MKVFRLFGLLPLVLLAAGAEAMDEFVYFGSHRSGPGIGFSLAHFDSDTGALTTPQFLLEARAPAFFVLHPDGRHLYICNSGSPGGVAAYEIDPHTGAPVEGSWRTVSVAAACCVDANIASTAAIVRGAQAPEWLEGLGLPARLVALDGTVTLAAGWPEPELEPR